MLRAREPRPRTSRSLVWRAESAVGGLLLIVSLLINTAGATERATWFWNVKPLPIDEHPERLWDWRQPQFLAKFLPYPPPQVFPDLSAARVDFSRPEGEKYLWYGWTEAEAGSLWADNDAALVFSLEHPEPQVVNARHSP